MRTNFLWPRFMLSVYHEPQTVHTHYMNGYRTGGPVVDADIEHAKLLGMTPFEHRIAHELAHHLVAEARRITSPMGGCRVLYAAAACEPQHLESTLDEWYVTAFTYYAFGANQREPGDYGALTDLAKASVDLADLSERFRLLMHASKRKIREIDCG